MSETGELGRDANDAWSRSVSVVVGIAAGLHVALLAYFTPSGLLLSGAPIHEYDYALHTYQVDRALSAFRETGHLWSYDPFVLAGQPAGAVEDLTSKSVELFVIAAAHFGANPWVAFDAYVLLIHLAMPLIGFLAARLLGLSRLGAAVTMLFWVVLWHFDSVLHWCWYVGMISWSLSSYLIVLVVALMYRAVRDHSAGKYVALGATAALVTLIHPFAVLTLAVPLTFLYARSFSRVRAWEHAALLVSLLAAALTTLVWIGPALRFRHDIGQVDAFLWPTLTYTVSDWLDLLRDVLMTGQPVRTAFRTVALALAAVELFRWHRRGDDRAWPLTLLVFGSYALCYLCGYSSVLRQTQPYRNMAPTVLAAAVVAAALVSESMSTRALRELDRNARTGLALGCALALPHLGRTILGYLPTLLPARVAARTAFRPGPFPGTGTDELPLIVLGHSGPSPDSRAVGRELERAGARGRVAAMDWVLGEYLSVFTHLPILGGIPQRNIPQVAAHPLRHVLGPKTADGDPLDRYLEEYAVGSVVVSGPLGPLDGRPDLLEPEGTFGDHRVYRVRREPSYFAVGSGRIAEQRLNSVAVTDAHGAEIVLRFHFLETLRCRPDCKLERAPAEGDTAGFIRVRNPPSTFEIYNSY